MKHTLPLITAMIVVLSVNTNRIQASTIDLPELSGLSEFMVYAPDVPGLPEEDDFLCADVNEDGQVNVLDIISLVSYIMGGSPSPFNLDAADIITDGNINVLDVISLVNIIMQVPGQPCGCVAPVTYEGQTYATVQIGEQCWFRESLNVGTKINSTTGGFQQTDNGVIEKYCYDNYEANCAIYGGLYEWPEAMQYVITEGAQGICPTGWHIPTDNEWKKLEGTVDSQYPVGDPEWDNTGYRGYDAGGNLKEAGTDYWNPPNTGAINSNGFTALPGGLRYYYDGYFNYLGIFGDFLSSSQNGPYLVWIHGLGYNYDEVYRDLLYKENGFAIRCLKGCWPEPTQANAGPDQLNLSGTSTTLAGNTPTYGTGVWQIISGTGGILADTTSPTSGFTGMTGNAYSLTWSITTICDSSVDTVQISFTPSLGQPCPGIPIVTYEGQTYNTVMIGDQCWLRENLNVGTKINSSSGGFLQSDDDVIEKYCYNNDEVNCDIYGGLYEWPEAMQYVTTEEAQGICPVGWHIPSDNEWKILEGTVDSQYPVGDPEWDLTGWRGSDAGGNLKEAGTTHWLSPNTGATNSSGFTALPAGYRSTDEGNFYYLGSIEVFWSSSQLNTNRVWHRKLYWNNDQALRYDSDKDYGFSVRCVKDG